MRRKPLTIKYLIKELEAIKNKYGDIFVGINVLSDGERSEFWGLDRGNLEIHDGGRTLCMATMRLRKALPANLIKNQKYPCVDSINMGAFALLQEFDRRYALKNDFIETVENSNFSMVDFIVETVKGDLEATARFYADVCRQLNCGKQPEAEEIIKKEYLKVRNENLQSHKDMEYNNEK